MDPIVIEQLGQELRRRANILDQKRKSIGPEQNRIGIAADLGLKLLAGIFDLVGLVINIVIPGAGGVVITIINVGANMVLIIGYLLLHIQPISGKVIRKTVVARVGTLFAELIPIINALPVYSLGVWYTNYLVRKEDKEYNKSIQNALRELAQEERSLQYDMQRYARLVQEYEQSEYNSAVQQAEQQQIEQYEEAAINNAINDEDDEDRRRAA